LLLPGARCCFGPLDILPAAGTSLALFTLQSAFRFQLLLFSISYRAVGPAIVLILEVRMEESFKKA
jgi:hypothetical protein